jgi:hypothetical protein
VGKFYSTARLSDNISLTPEGFLICEGVAITRAGELLYSPEETTIEASDGDTVITREIQDITSPQVIASFEGKPITIGHPENGDFVGPKNYKELSVGVIQNVRPGIDENKDKLLADLLINDFEAIEAVQSKKLREVSCGYEADFYQIKPGLGKQENIRGNHVAIVQTGRCGSECAIFDHAPNKGNYSMEKNISIDESMKSEKEEVVVDELDVQQVLKNLMDRMEDIEAKLSVDSEEEVVVEDEEKVEEEVVADEEEVTKTDSDILAAIHKMLTDMNEKDVVVDNYDSESKDMVNDSETLSKAEILAPGIEDSENLKAKALDSAYKTKDGKEAIDKVLSGKSFDSADKDLLFSASAEVLKGIRQKKVNTRVSLDGVNSTNKAAMTPSRMNEINKLRYSEK